MVPVKQNFTPGKGAVRGGPDLALRVFAFQAGITSLQGHSGISDRDPGDELPASA